MEQEFQFFLGSEIEQDDEQALNLIPNQERTLKVRLDKWLWAARFFKTRAIARAAIEKGKVFYNGERSKPSREIEIGAILNIRLGTFEKTVAIKGLSTRRRNTEEALQLFEETEKTSTTRFEQRSFDSIAQPMEFTKKKRTVRFLRRSFVRNDSKHPKTTGSCLKTLEVELTD